LDNILRQKFGNIVESLVYGDQNLRRKKIDKILQHKRHRAERALAKIESNNGND